MYHLCSGVVNLLKSFIALVYLRHIFLYFFTNLNWNKCWFIPIFCHRCGKHLDFTITVRRCRCGLDFEGTSSKILTSRYFRSSIPNEQFLWSFATFSIYWVSSGSFSPELCFIRCSKDTSSKNRVKGCSMGCNVGFPKTNFIYWVGHVHSLHSVKLH